MIWQTFSQILTCEEKATTTTCSWCSVLVFISTRHLCLAVLTSLVLRCCGMVLTVTWTTWIVVSDFVPGSSLLGIWVCTQRQRILQAEIGGATRCWRQKGPAPSQVGHDHCQSKLCLTNYITVKRGMGVGGGGWGGLAINYQWCHFHAHLFFDDWD